jgi:hypothetical protein
MGKKHFGKTTAWSEPKIRSIDGEERLVQTRYFQGKEQVKICEQDLRKTPTEELNKQIPIGVARKKFRRNSNSPELDKSKTAEVVFERPNKRWLNDMQHYDVETIDAPKGSANKK